ncbi:proton-conducting transporter transmembrane domain-containing protein [Pseudonocardia abyssalis]|uniref:Hydrogenase 4 subunit B n=1 Tax=Pseudonocardia abyssalis TaxID=2792008 RepID=A0ABS6UNS0_9PSEU|nr:proton-conducting transporter membrane subunit [Pseudonocardia abyssalis]MBW0118024.1 hydrogenase 4 subunit B [Pseudonocardia abyssalis]MBW0133895.1 hydrogenase 4 subunit B [Pseudonocardia abyssalis]
MNPVGAGLSGAVLAAVLTVLAAVVVPRGPRPVCAGAGTVAVGLLGALAGVAAVLGTPWSAELPDLLPLTGVVLAVDPLGGVFLAVGGAVVAVSAVYGIGYTRHALDGRAVQAAFPLFALSLLLVPAAGGVGTFLLCWELMALASLLLVLAEHRQRPAVASAARWYAVTTHLGFVAILAGLLLLAAPGDSFAAIRAAPAPASGGLVFVLCLVGFGSKAGIVPLHAWLPRAHPEAPSHVSALMSAAMVALGVYGIVRVGFDLLGGGSTWWWVLVLVLGAVSGVYGILQAVVVTDLKALLGFSTTENMGLVLVGVGAAGLFASTGRAGLAALALTAALLHVVGHAAYKTLLFLAAGSVLHATGTRDLDTLGGLRPTMPATTLAFGLGALAASALPPGTAFVSEWVLLQALIRGLDSSGASVVLPLAVGAVALTAGLAVATFVKAFGVGFLARPRSDAAAAARESPPTMVAAMALAGVACVGLAVAPTLVLPGLGRVAGALVGAPAPVTGTVAVELVGVDGAVSPALLLVALLGAVAVVVAVPRLLAARRARRGARLWDCGGGRPTARMEYTATSFAEPMQRVFENVLRPEQDVDVTHHRESRYLVEAVEYRLRVPDRIERRLYAPVLTAVAAWGVAGRRLANGSVHRYLGYGFWTVCALLVALVVLR